MHSHGDLGLCFDQAYSAAHRSQIYPSMKLLIWCIFIENTAYLRTPIDMFEVMFADETSQRMNSGQPLIARGDTAVSGCFNFGEKFTDDLRRDVGHPQPVYRFTQSGGDKVGRLT